jgi:hypothetical protein
MTDRPDFLLRRIERGGLATCIRHWAGYCIGG